MLVIITLLFGFIYLYCNNIYVIPDSVKTYKIVNI